MKQSVRDDIIQSQMRPGVITRDGLLGTDRRGLRGILEADEAAVARLGLTHAAVAARLRELRDAGARGLGLPVRVRDRFEVTVEDAAGELPCPFLHVGLYPKLVVDVRNLRTGERLVFSGLNLHMIEAHGFYEGRGAPYRLDPATLARVLELAPAPA